MNNESLIYITPQVISLLISVIMVLYLYKKSSKQLIKLFILLMLNIGFWSLSSIIELTLKNNLLTILFGKLSYLSVTTLPVLILLFVLDYINKKELITKKNITLLLIIPLTSLLLIITNDYHNLFFSKETINQLLSGLTVSHFERGVMFWVFAIYSYLLIITATVLIIKKMMKSDYIYRKQSMLLLIGVLVPFIGNLLYIFKPAGLTFNYDLTTLLLVITQLLFVWSIKNYQLFNLIPIARKEVFNNLTEAVIIINKDDEIIDINNKALELINKKQVIGEKLCNVFNKCPEELKNYNKISKAQFKYDKHYYTVNVDKIKQNNKLIGKIITINDITSIKKADELKTRVEQEQKINSIRNQFLMRVSHELRRPLVPIIGYSTEALNKTHSITLKRYLNKVITNANQLKKLINRVITFTSINSGDKLSLINTKLDNLINEVITQYEKDINKKKIKLIINLQQVKAVIDPFKLKEALNNLIDNAIKYGRNEVSISLKAKKETAIITIINDGLISDEVISKINKGTYIAETDSSKLIKGFGIGLMLTKLIIKMHKGKLILNNDNNQTTIIIKIPIKQ